MKEIDEMAQWTGAQLNSAKVRLADEATALLHGPDCLKQIHATAAALFGAPGATTDLDSLPRIPLGRSLESGVTVVELLIKASMAMTKSEARRLIKGGGARINDQKVNDENATVRLEDFDAEGLLKLSSGKKNHVLITR
jgi:tyrosyl-tRNA synthetase